MGWCLLLDYHFIIRGKVHLYKYWLDDWYPVNWGDVETWSSYRNWVLMYYGEGPFDSDNQYPWGDYDSGTFEGTGTGRGDLFDLY